jgi:hypothetical protein
VQRAGTGIGLLGVHRQRRARQQAQHALAVDVVVVDHQQPDGQRHAVGRGRRQGSRMARWYRSSSCARRAELRAHRGLHHVAGDVLVVGAHAVGVGVGRGQHEHHVVAQPGVGSQVLQELEAVHVRHVQVQQRHARARHRSRGVLPAQRPQRLFAVFGPHHREHQLCLAQAAHHGLGGHVVVFHQQDGEVDVAGVIHRWSSGESAASAR